MLSISLFIYNDFVLLCSFFFFFFNDTATTEIYTLSLHDALPILLKEAGVERLVDVRSVPRSRANPQFNADALPDPLAAGGIGYTHLAALGGLRHHPKGAPVSPNTLWRSDAFRNYADYAMTPAFGAGLDRLCGLAHEERCAIMCAE